MKNCFLLLITFSLSTCFLSAQKVSEVIDAERSFALYALEHNTKNAFLQYMDSNAVVFDKGQVLDAKKVWTANAVSLGKLLWKPAFAGISNSGDLGFTTGPWEYKPSLTDTALAVGEFATIWRKTGAGEWKFVADIGLTLKKPLYQFTQIKTADKGTTSAADTSIIFQLEAKTNAAYKQLGASAFVNFASDKSWFILNNHHPLQGMESIRKNITAIMPSDLDFKLVNGNISSTGDLAYAYGNVIYKEKQENYLRVWQNTKKGWRLVMMVVQ
jgi:ketosteroid isomerase-like protein